MQYQFPPQFDWGTASASYQIEGAWNEDGKGESIWDRYCRTPGKIHDGTSGDVVCDFYHRYKEDIALLKSLGIKVYRMSVSWPRIMPTGTGEVNEKGIDFYRRVLTELRAAGIKTAVTLYHWDLPQKLQEKGGWMNRDSVEWFGKYAEVVFARLGDLVNSWITLNEPFCATLLSYWFGEHAPGYHDYGGALSAVHHILMAHGAAVKAFRASGAKGEIGITLNMNMAYPFDPANKDDVRAARLAGMQSDELFGDPVYLGKYPEELFAHLAKKGVALPDIQPGDMELIKQKLDFFGLNTYFTDHIKYDAAVWPLEGRPMKTGRDKTEADWEVNPQGMYDLLTWVTKRYNPAKIIITENGAASNDWVNVDGEVEDPNRVDYLKRYLAAVHKAIADGAPVAGYYVWCFCDNFEWTWGLSRRFGIVHVDYTTQKRIPKSSAKWYSGVIRNNGF